MGAYLQLTITDTVDPRTGGGEALSPMARMVRTAWCHLPADWVVDGALVSGRRAILVDGVVGKGRTAYRGRFVVLRVQATVLTPAQARARPWLGDVAGFYRCGPDGVLREVFPSEL
ncbi:hypothetical protein AB0J90_04960 [Micromonospora sp. NPDC049523]|uniref:hypothetical protein n=1 Tax=Micromonospora sp. NPDC049523 TaxID=3155921 RepID=UPI003427A9CD